MLLKKIIGDQAWNSLSDEQRKQYEKIDLVDSTEYVEKTKYEQVITERDDAKTGIKTRDKQISTLKDKVKDNDELVQTIDTMKEQNKKDLEAKDKEYKDTMLNNAVNAYLKTTGALNIKVVKSLIDVSKCSLDGDNIIGLEDQVKAIKKSDAYLFNKEVKGSPKFNTTKVNIADETGAEGGEGHRTKSLGERLAQRRFESNPEYNKEISKFIRR